MHKNKTISPKTIIPFAVSLMLLFAPFNNRKAYAVTDTPTPTVTAPSNMLAESTFDTGTENWTIINDGTTPTYKASGGESGGYIESKDKGSGSYWYWSAPAEFLGNKSVAYGGQLTFYLK